MNLVHEGVLDPNEPDFRDEKREEEEARRARETLANIVAEMRMEVGYGKDTYCGKRVIHRMEDVRVMQFCDRIEAAWKRERVEVRMTASTTILKERVPVAVGNAAAMREALVLCVEAMCRYCRAEARACDLPQCLDGCETLKKANAALSAPPRNCDVGTPEEQGERCLAQFDQWRRKGDGKKLITAIMNWAKTPYTAQEGGAK